jgi:hypothetical protein
VPENAVAMGFVFWASATATPGFRARLVKPISGAPKTAMVTANVGGVNASVIWISAVMLVRLGSAVDAVVMATAATGQVLLRHRFGWARLREVNDRGSVMPQQVHRKRRVQGRERTDPLCLLHWLWRDEWAVELVDSERPFRSQKSTRRSVPTLLSLSPLQRQPRESALTAAKGMDCVIPSLVCAPVILGSLLVIAM